MSLTSCSQERKHDGSQSFAQPISLWKLPGTVAMMELLHELSAEHQVILFSQEDEVVEWAQRNIDPARDQLVLLDAP